MTDPQDDIAYLRRMIDNARRALVVDTLPLLIWCGLTLAGVLAVYLMPALDSIWLWLTIIGIAWVLTGARAVSRKDPAVSLSHRTLARLWFGLFTAMTLIGFVGVFTDSLPPTAITPIVAALFGVGCLVSATLLDRASLIGLAVAWWTGAAALFLLPPPWRLAVFGGLILLLLAIPVLRVRQTARRT
jgi:hypothetical protein